MLFFFIPALFIALLLEGAVTTVPLVLICLLCLLLVKRGPSVFAVAFLAGMFLDILTVKVLGTSSLFFIIFLFLILLYQRKYEINSYPFVAAAAFLGSVLFLLVFGYGNWFWQSVISSLLALLLFGVLKGFSVFHLQTNHSSHFRKV